MLGNISDEETNKLIYYVSENVRENLIGRVVVESELFPVTHYIHVACQLLYDQAFSYKITKEIAKIITPEEIGKRNKTLASYRNQLDFNSYIMLYLHGRAQIIYDNLEKKATGNTNIIVEPEEKKKETKFILDFWSKLCPNYLDSGTMAVEDGSIRFLSQDFIDSLLKEMRPIKPELNKKLKRTIGLLTSRNFLASADCRSGNFNHGPYETDSPDEVLIFKEFTDLYTGKNPLDLDIFLLDYQKTEIKSKIPNIIIGMTLKNMKSVKFNDWGTCFSEPSDFSQNITSIGLWTKELIHPSKLSYPDNLGNIEKLPIDILDHLIDYSQKSLNEMFIEVAGWNEIRRIMAGVNVYTNFVSKFTPFAKLENKWDWGWTNDVALDQQNSDLVNTKDVKRYIEELRKHEMGFLKGSTGFHPFLNRFFQTRKKRMKDPSYYSLKD